VYRFAATLFYANSARLVSDVRELLVSPPDPLRLFILDGSEIHFVDWTSSEALHKTVQMVQAAGARFQIARLPEEARNQLDYFGITDELGGPGGYIKDIHEALAELPLSSDDPVEDAT
jgi:MFS superfamily sulfate permease-like transporter